MSGIDLDDFVDALARHDCKPTPRGNGFIACCPAHDDQNPSLSVDRKSDGGVLAICRSQSCTFESILDALELKGVGYEQPLKMPYPTRKGVKVHSPATLSGDSLIIPCVDIDGKVRGTQTIWPEKRLIAGKETDKMTKGTGQAEYFFTFGDIEQSDTLLLATGYATSASLFESTGSPTVMSMSDTTLPRTVEIFRKRYAEKELIVCCDYDARSNKRILESVNRYNARLCFPEFVDGNLKTDFNDLMLAQGKSAVCDAVGDARFISNHSVADKPLQQHKSNAASKIMSASDLWLKEFKPIRMIVTPILPEGVTLLVSPPKIGKTRLAGQLAIAVASGGYALNHPNTITNKTSVLFMALESGDRRAQKDLKQMIENPPDGLFVVTEWPRLNDGGAVELEQWLDQNLDCKLVIIDTIAKVRDSNHGGNGFMYTADYEAGAAIKSIADKRNISILLLHHANKMNDDGKDLLDTVSGSTGVTGSVDHILFLKRNRLEPDGLMTLISRDFEDRQFAMTFKDGLWTLIGDPNEAADDGWRGDSTSDARHEILSALRKEPMKPAELATRIGKNPNTTRRLLQNLAEAGQVTKRFDGKYSTL